MGDLVEEFGFFDAGEDFSGILVGIGSFVDGIFLAVEEDVVLIKFLIDGGLIQSTCGGPATEASARSVVHRREIRAEDLSSR